MAAFTKTQGFWLGMTLGTMTAASIVAGAQTANSPFAKKNKTQAWESYNTSAPTPTPSSQGYGYPQNAPQTQSSQGTYQPPSNRAPSNHSSKYNAPQQQNTSPSGTPLFRGGAQPNYAPPPQTGGSSAPHYVGAGSTAPQNRPYQNSSSSNYQNPSLAGGYNPPKNNSYHNGQQNPYPYNSQLPYPQPRSNGTWQEKAGFKNIKATLSGFLKVGGAGVNRKDPRNDGWNEDILADARLRGEVSAITPSGFEYGLGAELRAQRDIYRRGFGGRVGDCPAHLPACGSTLIAGIPTPIRGHTTQFYTQGPNNAKKNEIALEGAYLFLRSAYGDFTVGRDDGAAYLFSLGAPSVVMVNASNSPVDYTGLDSVKTVNDASGFSEKITYTSPRVLGDQIGVGVQMGMSYALNAKACGVDYCVRKNGKDGSTALAPDLKNVVELGLSLDRKFDNGMSIEATATYAMASEKTDIAEFDSLKALGLGLEFGMGDLTFGTSYLNSNNGLQNGDYSAYDVGLKWKPGRLGASLAYGHAEDKNVLLKSDQATFGLSYDVTDNFQLGTGVQHIQRKVSGETADILRRDKERSTALFIEGGIKF
ncbi:MAG: porin [Maricaulaceae bacterium]